MKWKKKAKPFLFIPILFSGTHETSIIDDITDNIYIDFTQYRTIADKNGNHIVPDYVKSQFDDIFTSISARFQNTKNMIEKSFLSEYNFWLDLLFVQDKHEVLRRRYTFNNISDLLDSLFVKTKAYNRIVDGEKCILIGRKGSGKSTIVDHFDRARNGNYKPPIKINVDDFDLSFLYNFVYTHTSGSDIGNVIRLENYFEACWKIFILQQCSYTLIDEDQRGRNTADIGPHVDQLREFSRTREPTKWGQFVSVCTNVRNYIDYTIKNAHSGTSFFPDIADHVSITNVVQGTLTDPVLNSLRHAIGLCMRKFIFALDGFDQRFEDFRTANLASSTSPEEANHRIHFEISWLKGLLRAILDYRSGDEIIQDKVDFCVTIPQDRYMEVRETERDDYRLRSLAANLQWSAFELAILLRKRLEGLTNVLTSRDLAPVPRLNEVLESDELELPTRVDMRVAGNVLSLSLFKYLLRHTFWRPRDIMFYVAAILATRKYAQKHNNRVDQELIKQIVSRTTYDIIDTEFIKEYQNNFTNIRDIIQKFEGSKIIITYNELSTLLRNVSFGLSGGQLWVHNDIKKIDILYEIGFLGVENDRTHSRERGDNREMFVFSDGIKRYSTISNEKKKILKYVIHPKFVEYLVLDTDIGRIVCIYSDDYLRENDILNE